MVGDTTIVRSVCNQPLLFTKQIVRTIVVNSCVNLRPTSVVVQRIINGLDRVVTEITLLTAVVKLKFCYQLMLERFVYFFLHLRHFKRHRKRLSVSKVLYGQMNAA